jgi:uncharacterized protein with von Willebrand factor type A (vWA) domain
VAVPTPAPCTAATSLNAPYHRLAGLPRALWLTAVACSAAPTAARLAGLVTWRAALLAGVLPDDADDWGDAPATGALRQVLGDLALPALTAGHAGLADQVLGSVLWHLDTLVDRPVGQPRAVAIAAAAEALRADWRRERHGWEQVLGLLESLGDLAHLRWDELQGRLSRREWAVAERAAARLRQLPALAAFIDRVGRARRDADLPPRERDTPAAAPPRPLSVRAVDIRLVDQPGAVRGVKRSGQLARMLASEAVQLHHPVLRRLWRARLAESQLLTYEDEAVLTQWVPAPDARQTQPAAPEAEPLGRGPLIICLDTSGSMRGAPESVARAGVLQALRSAHAAGRACQLLAFGAAGEVVEHELALTAPGLDALLDTMGLAFDGGTDVQTPLERAIERVGQAGWALADVLILSDGEFGVTPATLASLRAAKARLGLRVHGVLIGDRETIGLLETCDSLHWVRDWRRHADDPAAAHADGFSPVHSRSLTAQFFPNAIRRG